jgi:transcriptional regulator with XRE-family HTH domain
MGDFRKYACDISGELFKAVNKKGIRREKLASELGISVNQIKNYAYDSSKSATLENFLYVLTKYKCVDVLNMVARDMDCCVSRLPEVSGAMSPTDAAADALQETARAVAACMEKSFHKDDVRKGINSAIEKLVVLSNSI